MGKHKFQIQLSGQWKDYYDEENAILGRAYMSGSRRAQYTLRGNEYEYDFGNMIQRNKRSGKERKIRPPPNLKPPGKPLVKAGPTMMVIVPPGAVAGAKVSAPHPQNPAIQLQVVVPPGAQPGSTLLVPVPPLDQNRQPPVMANMPQAAPMAIPSADPAGATTKDLPPADSQDKKSSGGCGGIATAAAIGGGVALGGAAVYLTNPDAVAGAVDAIGDTTLDNVVDGAVDIGGDMAEHMGDALGDAGNFIMNLFD